MKSKTSCFNTTIFKKNFTHYWPIWAVYLCFLIAILPLNLWSMITRENYYGNSEFLSLPYYMMEDVLSAGLSPFPVFLFAAIMALAVFSYLYSARNANMIHSLPVNRLELFVTNYLSGLLFLLIPQLIAFIASVLVCVANQITSIQYLFVWIVYSAGMTFFAYSLAVFVAMFTGHVFAMPVYYFILNYLYVGGLFIVCALTGMVSYGISDSWNPGASCILSPLYYLGNNLRVRVVHEGDTDIVTGLGIKGGYLIGIYAIVAVVLVVAAYLIYRRRNIETAGDFISVGIVKPIFRWGVALYGSVGLSLIMAEMVSMYHPINVFFCIIAGILIFGFICFFIAEMLLRKSFRVLRKKRILEWAVFSVVSVLFICLFKMDAFGVEHYLPEEEDVEMAFVYLDFPMDLDKEEIPVLLELHQKVIESKQEYLANAVNGDGYYYTTFRYYLKDGSMVERRYPLPVTEDYLKDASSPTAKILEWEQEPERILSQIFGRDYEKNDYYSASLDLYAEDGNMDNYIMNKTELEQVIAAMKRDVDEGNFIPYYCYSLFPEEESYVNGISLNYYNYSGYYDNWNYYSNYRSFPRDEAEDTRASVGNYVSFGPKCTNLIETLEKLGIVDETWKLFVYEEYRSYMN